MARMLEALKQADMKRLRQDEGAPVTESHRPHSESVLGSEEQGPIPFIEVGGRGSALEASADVLASGPPPATKPAVPPRIENAPRLVPPPVAPADSRDTVLFRSVTPEPLLAAPASRRFAPELVAFHRPADSFSEHYRKLLAGMEAQLPAGQPLVLLFTSAAPGVGTTTVLLNVAITSAHQGKMRVLAADVNLHRPAFADRLGLRSAPGLGEVLARGIGLEEALQETGQPQLHALTAGHVRISNVRQPAETLRSVLAQLRERFDRILVDVGCWDGRPETICLGSLADAIYVVAPHNDEQDPEVVELMRVIPRQGGRLHGCILVNR